MNVLILNYEYPPLGGGAGVCTMEHAKGLVALGHHVTVITTWFEKLAEEETNGALKIIRLKAKRAYLHESSITEKLSWMFLSRNFLIEYCNNNTFDVCMAHFTIPGAYVAKALKKKFGIPFLIISHGHDIPWFFPKQMFFYHLFTYHLIKKISNSADAIVVLNENLKTKAVKFLSKKNKNKVFVIPNGCNTAFYKQNTSKKSETFKIIFTGRLVAQKDPMTFLKALSILEKNIADFNVEIIGEGVLKNRMIQYAKKNKLENKIFFRGWIDKNEMLLAYQSAHVQVMTSLIEAMSMSALESLSTGVFLITTKAGNNARLVENKINGFVIPYSEPDELAGALQWYYHNKFVNNYIIPADSIHKFRNDNDWENILKLYNQLLDNIRK